MKVKRFDSCASVDSIGGVLDVGHATRPVEGTHRVADEADHVVTYEFYLGFTEIQRSLSFVG